MTRAAVLNGAALFHTAKCCTNTVARSLCPPFKRVKIETLTNEVTVGFVRHPLDRLVSCWADTIRPNRIQMITHSRLKQIPIEGIYVEMPFDEFAEVVIREPKGNTHWFPQVDWLTFRGKFPDRIIHYERLLEEWQPFVDEFGWPEFPSKRLNSTDHPCWEDLISEEQQARLIEVYRQDFEVFGYEIG